jgi:hypothetical protein
VTPALELVGFGAAVLQGIDELGQIREQRSRKCLRLPAALAATLFEELMAGAYPNPERIGCPPRDVLITLARRQRPIGDRAYEHLKICSPCYQEGRAIQEADALEPRRRV